MFLNKYFLTEKLQKIIEPTMWHDLNEELKKSLKTKSFNIITSACRNQMTWQFEKERIQPFSEDSSLSLDI